VTCSPQPTRLGVAGATLPTAVYGTTHPGRRAMRWSSTRIAGVIEFTPSPHVDDRGFFSRTFDADVAREAGIDPDRFVQDSMSRSRRGVIRGLHVRLGEGESKLVRCSSGRVFDVVVDLRPGSPTHGEWLSVVLDGEKQNSVFIPAGCAHGFQALTEPADTAYRIDRRHDPREDLTIAHDDPQLAVPWPLPASAMSRSDATALPLAQLSTALGTVTARAQTEGQPPG
jgi:dTDP-4-dehydrorhamnose 3,5-epimerase